MPEKVFYFLKSVSVNALLFLIIYFDLELNFDLDLVPFYLDLLNFYLDFCLFFLSDLN